MDNTKTYKNFFSRSTLPLSDKCSVPHTSSQKCNFPNTGCVYQNLRGIVAH